MNRLEEIQECIKEFVYEKQQVQQQISEFEEKRTQLAEKRNEIKKANTNNCVAEIDELGKQISELGNQSQELQNKLDSKFNEVKAQINLRIDNLITEGIRKILKIDEERESLEITTKLQEERCAKYEIQKQEFYARFGRIPELSEYAKKEKQLQEQESLTAKIKIKDIDKQIEKVGTELEQLVTIKTEFKNKNWAHFIDKAKEEFAEEIDFDKIFEEAIELPLVEELKDFEEVYIEAFEPIEELIVEPFEEIGEIQIEEFDTIEDNMIKDIEENKKEEIDEIAEIAKAIVEEIATEQTKDININNIQENQSEEDEIITFEENKQEVTKIANEGKVTILNIIAKIENDEIVYKAQISNEEEITVYPTKAITGNKLLRDKESREQLKEILINYAVSENKVLDKKVIKKIDPIICEVLVIFANKYNYDAQSLIYNYAMSFSKTENYEIDSVPTITYSLSYLNGTFLTKKEKNVICKICKDAKKNEKVEMIGYNKGISGIKYFFKRLFAISNANALPEGEKE